MRATALHERALGLYRQLDDAQGTAFSLNNLAVQVTEAGEYDRAESLLDEALEVAQDLRLRGYAFGNLGEIALWTGDVVRACELHELGLQNVEDAGDDWGVLFALYNLGIAHIYRDDLVTGAGYLRLGLARAGALGDRSMIAEFLTGLATVGARSGRAVLGARLMGAVAALRAATGVPTRDVVLRAARARERWGRPSHGTGFRDRDEPRQRQEHHLQRLGTST